MDDKEALFNPIREKILKIRGQMVMLDRDLAGLYGVETKYLNRQVARNMEYFEGDDYMFQLTKEEVNKVVTIWHHLSPLRFSHTLPYAFTELGIPQLSSVLKSPIAVRVNRQIMRYFVYARKAELSIEDFKKYVETKFKFLEEKLKKSDLNFEIIFSLFEGFKKRFELPEKSTGKYGFKKNGDKKDNINLKNKKWTNHIFKVLEFPYFGFTA